MGRVITIGEALVEVMRPEAGQPLDEPGDFRGPFASGAPAIFAVAAARLGLQVSFIGAVGEDAFGRLLRRRLSAEGVDISAMQCPPGGTTGVAFVAYDAVGGGREFVFHMRQAAAGALQAAQIPEGFFKEAHWLHLSGSTVALNTNSRMACERAMALAKAAGGKVSLDPNLRPELLPTDQAREALAPFLAAADLVLPTAGETRALTGMQDDDLAARALMATPECIVALKRGPAGCSVYTAKDRLDVAGFAVEEVDPTGAGDCFSAAFIAGLEAGWPLERVGRFANAAGALAVTRLGPMEGAPYRQQVEVFLDERRIS